MCTGPHPNLLLDTAMSSALQDMHLLYNLKQGEASAFTGPVSSPTDAEHFSNVFQFPLDEAYWGMHRQLENEAVQKEVTDLL